MRKATVRFRPSIEPVEERKTPSTGVPVLTMHGFHEVAAHVVGVMERLARNHHVTQASQSLTALSTRIPFGRQELGTAWQTILSEYQQGMFASAHAATNQMVLALRQDVLHGVQAHEFRVVGVGSQVFNGPGHGVGSAASSVDSVKIVNRTGFSITVTAFLNGVNPRPSITRTIANGGNSLFDFGSNKNLYISVNVMQTGNPRNPPPLVNWLLNRPISGYNGASFSVSVFGGVFSIGS